MHEHCVQLSWTPRRGSQKTKSAMAEIVPMAFCISSVVLSCSRPPPPPPKPRHSSDVNSACPVKMLVLLCACEAAMPALSEHSSPIVSEAGMPSGILHVLAVEDLANSSVFLVPAELESSQHMCVFLS